MASTTPAAEPQQPLALEPAPSASARRSATSPKAPDTVYGVPRWGSISRRVRAALKAYTDELGACPWSNAELARRIFAAPHEVGGSLAYLKNTGEAQTVVRTIDDTDPRLTGRGLRAGRRAIMYVGRKEQSETSSEADVTSRRDCDQIEADLERALAAELGRYRSAIAAARDSYREAVSVLKAQATVARFEARKRAAT
jgi:hypothetical protein